jgi:hypothetical protein
MNEINKIEPKKKASKWGLALGALETGLNLNSAVGGLTKGGETPLQKLFAKKKGSLGDFTKTSGNVG